MYWIPDKVLLKIVDSVDRKMTRPRYEELMIDLELYSFFRLREDEEYYRLSKRELIIRSFQEKNEEILIRALYERNALNDEALQALAGVGIELEASLAADLAQPAEEHSRLEIALDAHGMREVLVFLEQSLENFLHGNHEASNAMTRTALEHMVGLIASRISRLRNNEEIPKQGRHISPVDHRRYLNSTGFLDNSEKEFLDKFYGYASTDGSHPGISTEEEARLRRFVVVAICLLFLEKLDNHAFMQSLT